jgi:hypothetical protein
MGGSMSQFIRPVYNSGASRITLLSFVIIIFLTSTILPQQHLDEEFGGVYRKQAKTSIVRSISTDKISRVKKFASLDKLLIYLPRDVVMRDKYSDLKIHATGPEKRKNEELHNVEVDCWVHAVKYEGGSGDRDFHIIVGSLPDTADAIYMNVEVSGLPDSDSHNYEPLRDARKQFLDLFSDYNFTTSFTKINPPLKVEIKGSLFFDGDHNHSCGTCPGPSYAKPGTVWEIHPVYSIVKLSD